MFSDNQASVLRILLQEPGRAFTMSELGRLLGKAPGVFQRGLNALQVEGYIVSRREANLRWLAVNTVHPLYQAIREIVGEGTPALPSDVYMTYPSGVPQGKRQVSEPPATYHTAARKVLIIAGPNGAGKTTFAREFLPREADCPQFINADYIAHGLSPFSPAAVAMKAGKVMLEELDAHIQHQRNVAVETTLSGLCYARWIPQWQQQGYSVKLIFLSLPSVEMAIARVASRVRQGGHAIPEATIRRRFKAGRVNFDHTYKPLVDAWAEYDNSGVKPVLVEEHAS